MKEGHPLASGYPVWLLIQEAEVARRRINSDMHTLAVMMQAAVATTVNSKKTFPLFSKLLEKLRK